MKLSPAMAEALELLDRPDHLLVQNIATTRRLYTVEDCSFPVVDINTKTVNALVDRNSIAIKATHGTFFYFEITDTGRAMLAEYRAKDAT